MNTVLNRYVLIRLLDFGIYMLHVSDTSHTYDRDDPVTPVGCSMYVEVTIFRLLPQSQVTSKRTFSLSHASDQFMKSQLESIVC